MNDRRADDPDVDTTKPELIEGEAERDGKWLTYGGMGLLVVSLVLSWWSLTKYRVSEQRGYDLASAEFKSHEMGMQAADRKEYEEELAAYRRDWELNRTQHGEFYRHQFGDDYQKEIDIQDARSWKSGTLSLRGWSTWTGWFALVFIVLLAASHVAPVLVPQLKPFAWTFPWAGVALFGLVTLMSLHFYFTAPDENGQGYSQGIGWGNYLAILGAGLVTAGCFYEGVQAVNQRVADLQAGKASADEEEEDEDEDDEPAAPPPPTKNRLQDW